MKKCSKQIVCGVLLFILGAIVIPTIFCITAFVYVFNYKPLATFTIPGQATVTVEKQGRYYLWDDYQTTFEGTTYTNSPVFPGDLEISLLNNQTGESVNFTSDQSTTYSNGDSYKKSIGYFDIKQPEIYILTMSGDTLPRVCSFGKSVFTLSHILSFLACFALSMTTAIVGFVLVIVGIMNLVKSGKEAKHS